MNSSTTVAHVAYLTLPTNKAGLQPAGVRSSGLTGEGLTTTYFEVLFTGNFAIRPALRSMQARYRRDGEKEMGVLPRIQRASVLKVSGEARAKQISRIWRPVSKLSLFQRGIGKSTIKTRDSSNPRLRCCFMNSKELDIGL